MEFDPRLLTAGAELAKPPVVALHQASAKQFKIAVWRSFQSGEAIPWEGHSA